MYCSFMYLLSKAIVVFIALWLALPVGAQDIVGIASVIDGDTIQIHDQRIRLSGIDAPESRQLCEMEDGAKWMCGQKAAIALAKKLSSRTTTCVQKSKDRYGRVVGMCFVEGRDVGEWMVRKGWALAYVKYTKRYAAAEAKAREKRLNIWGSKFDMPWDWRKARRSTAK